MRIRLLAFALLAFCQLHLQQSGVSGQKYYMNFAFNNNNPDGGSGDGKDGALPDTPDPDTDETGENHDSSGGIGNLIAPAIKSDKHEKDKSHEDESKHEDKDVSHETHHESKESLGEEPKGFDIDDDDSDSKDPPGRREKERQQEEDQSGERKGEHSHHSSYEISIDDSFGGRYVRSIYESSESHGREKMGKDLGDSFGKTGGSSESSESVKKISDEGELAPMTELYGNDDYEELN